MHCKDCGGAAICMHGWQRHTCKDCWGISLCTQLRIKSNCKECGGRGIHMPTWQAQAQMCGVQWPVVVGKPQLQGMAAASLPRPRH